MEEGYSCSIEGCIAVHSSRYQIQLEEFDSEGIIYGFCNKCEDFSICHRGKYDEPEHYKALLYNEGCLTICINCAVDTFKEKNKVYEEGEEHCICPECDHDFGLLKDLI